MVMRLGELLIQKKMLTKQQLDEALTEQESTKDFLGLILVQKKFVSEEDLTRVLSEQFYIPMTDLKKESIDWDVAMRFPSSIVTDHQCLPIRQDDYGITVAILNPLDAEAISKIEEQAKGFRVRLVLARQSDMNRVLQMYNQRLADKIKKMLED